MSLNCHLLCKSGMREDIVELGSEVIAIARAKIKVGLFMGDHFRDTACIRSYDELSSYLCLHDGKWVVVLYRGKNQYVTLPKKLRNIVTIPEEMDHVGYAQELARDTISLYRGPLPISQQTKSFLFVSAYKWLPIGICVL